eukprot:m51a1_g5037 hypothetical protein (236) ;mRNA; f:378916-379719
MALYHERQRLQLCALHSVNNLVQRRAYSKRDFDGIARELKGRGPEAGRLWNPHKTVLGQYDANVVVAALNALALDVAWHDPSRVPALALARRLCDDPAALGAIVNVAAPAPALLLCGSRARHWVALRRSSSSSTTSWWLHDSKAPRPSLVAEGPPAAAAHALAVVLSRWSSAGAEILVVLRTPADTPPPAASASASASASAAAAAAAGAYATAEDTADTAGEAGEPQTAANAAVL